MVKAMETPKGFKKTEVGIIPNDWELKKIGEVCQIFGRIGFRGYTVNDIVAEGNGAISISPSNIKDDKIEFKKCTYISWFKYEESPEIKIYNGDVLLVKTGSTFGKTAIVKNLPVKATVNPQLVVLKKIKVDNSFMSYMMGFKIVQNQITSAIVGGAIPTLSQQLVSKFQIPLPPTKVEQTAIAEALNDADALITELEKLLAKKKAIKQGTTYNLVSGKMRIKGFNKQWQETALSSYLKMPVTYGVVKAGVFQNTGTRMLRGGDIKDGRINTSDVPLISDEKNKEYSRTILETDDIVLALVGYPGEVARVPEHLAGANISRAVGLIRTNGKLNNEFLVHYFNSTIGRKLILAPSAGSAQVVVNLKDINKFRFVIPDIEEQTQIAQILSDMDAEIEALEQKLDKYKMLKQGMMQNLLTGKIRLI